MTAAQRRLCSLWALVLAVPYTVVSAVLFFVDPPRQPVVWCASVAFLWLSYACCPGGR